MITFKCFMWWSDLLDLLFWTSDWMAIIGNNIGHSKSVETVCFVLHRLNENVCSLHLIYCIWQYSLCKDNISRPIGHFKCVTILNKIQFKMIYSKAAARCKSHTSAVCRLALIYYYNRTLVRSHTNVF